MDVELTVVITVIVFAGLALAVSSAAGTAFERAKSARIQALAEEGDGRAKAIASRVEQPADLIGPLTTSRVFWTTLVIALMAYIGTLKFDEQILALVFGAIGGVIVAMIEMTVGLLATRGPEASALRLARTAQVNHWLFLFPSLLFSLPVRVLARSIEAVTPDQNIDIVSLVEREEATGGVEEQERRMIRGVFDLEDKTAREIMEIGRAHV